MIPRTQPNRHHPSVIVRNVLDLLDWRREVHSLYQRVRGEDNAEHSHALWRRGRDALFALHPQSPLTTDDAFRQSGLPYWPYDSALRWTLELEPTEDLSQRSVNTGSAEITTMRQLGWVTLPEPFDARLAVWWLEQYGGGLFLPIRDGTAGRSSYGGGRYLLDTAKGADLGGTDRALVIDLNFLFHPSCHYDSQWVCPLASPDNTISAFVEAGERLA